MPESQAPTLPVSLFLRLVLAALKDTAEQSSNRLARAPAGEREGRQASLKGIHDRISTLRAWMASGLKGEVRADVAALVAATACGHDPAMAQLQTLLAEIEHPGAKEVSGLRSRDVVGIVGAILGKGESGAS